jgi:DNA polymerase-3 subunit gamma/tau
MSRAILASDVPRLLQQIAEMDQAGKDMPRVLNELIEYFRDLLVVSHGAEAASVLELSESQCTLYQEQIAGVETGRILRVIDVLVDIDEQLRFALSKRTILETGLIRAAHVAESVTIDELMREIATLKKKELK